ncbi:synapsin-like [Dermacentor albipictus]|uniref:synapsin-like n=1 Tax=Dermacentor albipictus TaxID=60249 RepID=UPI0031FCC964
MAAMRQGTKVVRSFRPDMVLVRQHVRDGSRDNRPFLLGLRLGGVPAVNSLHSLYNFQDKPWVFAQLQGAQRRLGREQFPLVEQSFFPNHADMLAASKFPCVVKVGHAHGGLGKVRVQSQQELQDVAGLVALAGDYCVVEPFVEAKCDLHIQKIGSAYKCFVRKSISGHWKANVGSAMLEQVPLADRHRLWVDTVSELFGGLDICAVEVIQAKDGREFITEANDSAMQLLGESQEEDRRFIADLVLQRMQQYCRPPPQQMGGGAAPVPVPAAAVPAAVPPAAAAAAAATQEPRAANTRPRRESQTSEKGEDPDDTMRNLRKTFAGVFGDM